MDISRQIKAQTIEAKGIKFSLLEDGREIARAYLYLMYSDLHAEPFGLLEDVYVEVSQRGKGLGTKLVKQVIAEANERGCYKLIATSRKSRPKVHQPYQRLGFQERGLEFRIDLIAKS